MDVHLSLVLVVVGLMMIVMTTVNGCGGGGGTRGERCTSNTQCGGDERCKRSKNHYGTGGKGTMINRGMNTCQKSDDLDNYWSGWSGWTACDKTCGDGYRRRSRSCIFGRPAGKKTCVVPAGVINKFYQKVVCNTASCPEPEYFHPWGQWSACSKTCGSSRGWSYRYRDCINDLVTIHPLIKEKFCIKDRRVRLSPKGQSSQSKYCNSIKCPVDGYWLPWGAWSTCSKTCDGGHRWRSHQCVEGVNGGLKCWQLEDPGIDDIREDQYNCSPNPCSVDSYMSAWGAWTACSRSCGPGGSRSRSRRCVPPVGDGASCLRKWGNEPTKFTSECNTDVSCPADGYHGPWGTWSTCTRSCGGGERRRSRPCVPAVAGGRPCSGPLSEERRCRTQRCPIHGSWSEWMQFSECSVTCGGGTYSFIRDCDDPTSRFGGDDCVGDWQKQESCNDHKCSHRG